MRLEPLYSVRFIYPRGWEVILSGSEGREEQHFYFAEGTVEGAIRGQFRAANYPRRRPDRTFEMDMRGFIETADGAVIMLEYKGYGRAYPPGRRQVVGTATHLSGHEAYRRLNDAICVIGGEVRVPDPLPVPLEQKDVTLVFEVSELIWESPPA
jgi:hypothetical protein